MAPALPAPVRHLPVGTPRMFSPLHRGQRILPPGHLASVYEALPGVLQRIARRRETAVQPDARLHLNPFTQHSFKPEKGTAEYNMDRQAAMLGVGFGIVDQLSGMVSTVVATGTADVYGTAEAGGTIRATGATWRAGSAGLRRPSSAQLSIAGRSST